jgi:hypothetical protein
MPVWEYGGKSVAKYRKKYYMVENQIIEPLSVMMTMQDLGSCMSTN